MTKREERRENADRKIFEFMGIHYPYNRPAAQWNKKPNPEKIVVESDPHEPYTSPKVISAIEREKDAQTLICTGDVGDYYSKSRFRKTRHQSFRQEMRSVFLHLEWMATHFTHVRVMLGNHDDRPEKTLENIIDGRTDLLILTEANLLEELASFFDNIDVVGTQLNLVGIDEMVNKTLTHIYQHGDIVFTHGERMNMNRITLMQNISRWVREWSDVLSLKPYRVIAQAHNHADLRMSMGTEKWFLMPCAMNPLSIGAEYIYQPRMYGSPPSVGYSIFYQSNGETDYNRSGNILL